MKLFKASILLCILIQILACNNQPTQINTKVESIPKTSPDIFPKNSIHPTSRNPLLISTDFGKTWDNASGDLPKEIQVSFLEKKGKEIVMATDNLGIFISSQNRTQWTKIGKSLPTQKINSLHISGKTIFIGAYQNGIFSSDDNGGTWNNLTYNLPNLNVQSIWKLNNDLFAGTDEGIFKLLENEKKWHPTSVKAQTLSIYAFEEKLIAGTSQGTLISKNLGKDWNWIRQEGAVHYTHNIGKRIYELVLNGDLIYSDDWGQNWNESIYAPRSGSYVYEIAKVENYLMISNNYGIHRSIDDGQTWEHIFKTEAMGFFDFLVFENEIYGGTRAWDEYRKRKN